jgi:hypothetical protein
VQTHDTRYFFDLTIDNSPAEPLKAVCRVFCWSFILTRKGQGETLGERQTNP